MCKTFILLTWKVEKLGAKQLPVFFLRHPVLFYMFQIIQKYFWDNFVVKKKYFHFLEISPKVYQFLRVWFGRAILDTFLIISWDWVHIFQNRFLCWNRESEPVDLNTMNPIIQTTFFHL